MSILAQNVLELILLFGWAFLWIVGGWWLARAAFRLPEEEEGLIGFGIGLVVECLAFNFLVRILPISAAAWISAGVVFVCGLTVCARLGWRQLLRLKITLWHWLTMAFLVSVFFPISRGMAIFDDFAHLPTLSTMATGEIPPHFSLDPSVPYGYHYFLHLFAVQIMRVGHWYAWNAWDLVRVVSLALAVVLAMQWTRRVTASATAGLLAGSMILFATGTRWLLVLLPDSILQWLGQNIQMLGSGAYSGASLADALANAWAIEGGGTLPLPFAFTNGLILPGVLTLHVSTGLMTILVILLLLSTFHRMRAFIALPLTAILISANGLLDEMGILLNLAGWGLITLLWVARHRSFRLPATLWRWWGILLAAWLLIAVQGGAWTDFLAGLANRLTGGTTPVSYQTIGFQFAWPPALISTHLGILPLTNPATLITAIFEAGPLPFVLPLVIAWGWKAFKQERWFEAALAAETIVSLMSLLVRFTGSTGVRNTQRLYTFLPICLVLAVPLGWWWVARRGKVTKRLAALLTLLVLSGGIAIFFAQVPSAQRPVLSSFITKLDAMMMKVYWDRLEAGSLVFDPEPSRAVTLFGRYTQAGLTWYALMPEFMALVDHPDPRDLAQSSFSYAYIDESYWRGLSENSRAGLESACVIVVAEYREDGNWRRLLDLRGCR